MIQQNRQEILDTAAAEIAVEHEDFYYPGDPQTDAGSRYSDAYRLIQKNRDIIAETSLAAIETNFPSFVYPGADAAEQTANKLKCRRDIGYFIDAVSLDVQLASGNRYSRQFALKYLAEDGQSLISNGVDGEVAQSQAAFAIVAAVMKAAITNTLTTSSTFTDATYATTSQSTIVSSPFEGSWLSGATGTLTIYQDLTVTPGPATYGGGGGDIANNNAGACADVQTQIDTLVAITNTVLSDGDDSNLPAESVATMTGGGAKCKRDIGYFIDAVSLDAFKGGNTYARKFILQYFDVSGRPISNGLLGEEAESVTAFNKAL